MKVAILDDIHDVWASTAGVQRLQARADVHIFTGPFGDPLALAGFDTLVANRERTQFTRALLRQLPDLRLIVQTGNHANHIDLVAADELGVAVAQASGGFSIGAAELAIALTLAAMRGIPGHDAAIRAGRWRTASTPVLHGKTLGIVGLGRVGQHVARIARAFGMRLLAWSPRLTDEQAARYDAARVELDDLLRAADVVSIHAALTRESRGLIDQRRLGLMKPTAYLINTARGAIVDETALIDALAGRRLAGAGLDVFATEPLPPGHPLTELSNVVLTPHIGWPTDEGYRRFADAAAAVLFDYLDGRPVPRFGA